MGRNALRLGLVPFVFILSEAAPLAAETGTSFRIPDTGQTQCYSVTGRESGPRRCPAQGQPGFGQDAQYEINPPHLVDNGDGTVTDRVTGLMWQKAFARDVSFAAAPSLAASARTGGHSDWRVPTTKELYSLIDFAGSTGSGRPSSPTAPRDAVPFIDTDALNFEYGTAERFIDAQYVTQTAYRGRAMGQPAFFGVNFADGRIKGYPQRGRRGGEGWYARFVRGNPDYGRNAFRDEGNGAVTDRATGLQWMQADSGDAAFASSLRLNAYEDGRMDWPEALAFCEGPDHAGHDDWRLPSAKELQSIVDYSRSPSATNSAAIDPVFAATAERDEAGKRDYPGYWSSTTLLDGPIKGADAIVVYFGEALGAPQMLPPGGGASPGAIIDVHGAGAQRSDPKTGDPSQYPIAGFGPQGDVRRVYNFVRCVRTAG